MSIQAMLEPIHGAHPCGEDLAFSPELDAISKARQADDPSLDQGAWVTALKEADWPFVAKHCSALLEKRSKDLQLAVWLTEALAKTAGMRGLTSGLQLVAGLCERYWEQLYPLPDEGGHEQRIGNLCWLSARLPALLHDIALTEQGAYAMRDIEVARLRGADAMVALEAARGASSAEFYRALLDDSGACLQAIADLERIIDDRLGADGPGMSAGRTALQGVIHFITPAAREAGVQTGQAEPQGRAAQAQACVSGPIQDRAQALAQLRAVAQFFRRTEPHSPVAYLADKAAHWGEQPLHVWLRAVVKDQTTLAHVEELLGFPE